MQRSNVKVVAAFLFVFAFFLILGAYLALIDFLDTLLSMLTMREKHYLQQKIHHRRNDCLWWTPLPSANASYCRARSGLSPPSC